MSKPDNKSSHNFPDHEQGKAAHWKMNRGAQPVSDLVSKLLNPVVERRAGMTTDVITSWDHIAGSQHAERSRPEKLIWPRQVSDDDPFEPATLIVACESGHALYLQHDVDAVIQRINTYFGFAAVARIKLTQKPITRPQVREKLAKPQIEPETQDNLNSVLETVTDPKLREALEKMGRGVFSSRSGK